MRNKIDKYLPDGFFQELAPYTNLHNLNLDWILHTLKKYEYTYKRLYDIITDIVDEELDKLIYEKVIALLGFINVVNPPTPLEGLDNTGASDNSAKLGEIFKYMKEHDNCAIYFPSGVYSMREFNVPDGIALLGECMHDTTLSLLNGAQTSLINGEANNVTIANLTLDANGLSQSEDVCCISILANNVDIARVIMKDGYIGAYIQENGGYCTMEHVIIDSWIYGGLYLAKGEQDPDICVIDPVDIVLPVTDISIDHIQFHESSGRNPQYVIKNAVDRVNINDVRNYGNKALLLLDNSGECVNITMRSKELTEMNKGPMTGIITLNCLDWEIGVDDLTEAVDNRNLHVKASDTQTIEKRKVVISGTDDETIGTRTVEVVNDDGLHVGNDRLIEIMGELHEEVEEDVVKTYHKNIGESVQENKTTIVTGKIGTSAASTTTNVSGAAVESVGGNVTKNYHSNMSVTVAGSSTIAATTMEIEGENEIYLKTNERLKYGEVVEGEEFFDHLPMQDRNGKPYDLLVEADSSDKISAAIASAAGAVAEDLSLLENKVNKNTEDIANLEQRVATNETNISIINENTIPELKNKDTDLQRQINEIVAAGSGVSRDEMEEYVRGEIDPVVEATTSHFNTVENNITILQSDVRDVYDQVNSGDNKFQFAVTTDGKPGYVWKDDTGADTVYPFSRGGNVKYVKIFVPETASVDYNIPYSSFKDDMDKIGKTLYDVKETNIYYRILISKLINNISGAPPMAHTEWSYDSSWNMIIPAPDENMIKIRMTGNPAPLVARTGSSGTHYKFYVPNMELLLIWLDE